ncbi:MAG: hypothetical protein JSS60_04250 [Verrucomicrobia bacterium]|nr:hypothetical protein [Verrucomicrobiota bacterium]
MNIVYSFRLPEHLEVAAAPTATPAALSSDLLVESGELIEGDWKNSLLRFFVPYIASSQDRKVSDYFIAFFKDYFKKEGTSGAQRNVLSMLALAERHISKGRGLITGQSSDTCRLERYTLAVRERLNQFDPDHSRAQLREKCRSDNAQMFAHWKKQEFAEEAFWKSPDLVDFISDSHLHRFIRYADYQHTIEMRPVLTQRNGTPVLVSEPHLKMNGRMTPWSKISQEISVDEEERLYSLGPDGKKIYWMYQEDGLVMRDRHDFSRLHHFKSLPTPPASCQVQIVTSHYPREKWGILEYLTKGNIHTHFRIIPREGFSASHPGSELQDGKVYSIGYGARWQDVAQGQPMNTIPGLFYNPDSTEFFKEDLMVTTLDKVTDEQLLKVVEITKRRSKELRPFNIATHNCSSETTEILHEAGVVDLPSALRGDRIFYEALVPKFIRRGFDALGRQLSKVVPAKVSIIASYIAFVPFVLFVSPFLLALGAWRTKQLEPEDQRKGVLKPMLSSIFDIFDPGRFTVDMTKNVTKWQKKQPNTVYVEQR